jgi:hypothetical protein
MPPVYGWSFECFTSKVISLSNDVFSLFISSLIHTMLQTDLFLFEFLMLRTVNYFFTYKNFSLSESEHDSSINLIAAH